MTARKPIVFLGTGPDFTGLTQLKTADTLAGVVNHADFGNHAITKSDGSGVVTALNVPSNTFVANLGAGIVAATVAEMKTALSIPILLFDTERTTSLTAVLNTLHPVDVRAGSAAVTPPTSPTAGATFVVCDSRANSATNNITVNFVGASQKLYGADTNYVFNVNGLTKRFRYINGTIGWIVE